MSTINKHLWNQINLSLDRLWSFDKDLKCVLVNDAMSNDFKTAFGKRLKEGDDILDGIPVDTRSIWKERYERVLLGETVTFSESYNIEGLPERIEVIIVPVKEEGKIIGGVCTAKDISKRVRARKALQKKEAYLKAQIENTTDSIWSIDRNYKLLTINSALQNSLERKFGVNLSVGHNLLESLPEPFYSKWKYIFDLALTGEDIKDISNWEMDGDTQYMEVSFNPIFVGDKIEGVACFSKDVTSLKNSEMRAINALETKDKLMSIIAHDLRGPVGNILELTRMLESSMTQKPAQEDTSVMLQHLKTSAENVSILLENLLSWSLSQQNKIKVEPELLNVAQVVEDSIRPYKKRADTKGVETRIEVDEGLSLTADLRSLSSAIGNMYSNAVKYTEVGGFIRVQARLSEEEILFSIEDNGRGMSAERLKNLFKDQEVKSLPGTQREQGTGLGLVLCKEFIKLNGGKVWVESKEKKGSTFFFTIPL